MNKFIEREIAMKKRQEDVEKAIEKMNNSIEEMKKELDEQINEICNDLEIAERDIKLLEDDALDPNSIVTEERFDELLAESVDALVDNRMKTVFRRIADNL